jgi:hypothetical protein
MIKFFRKIRQKLLSENKFSKYLIYAIGEIILVVIGILIALQINNGNEYRKERAEEIKMLENFKTTIKGDFDQVNSFSKTFDETDRAIYYLLKHMEEGLAYNDSLKTHFRQTTALFSPKIDQEVFATLSSTDLNIISNDSLKNEIISYYSFAKRAFDVRINRYAKIMEDASKNIFSSRFNELWGNTWNDPHFIDSLQNKTMKPKNYEELKKDEEYLYFLKSLKNQLYWYVRRPLKQATEKSERVLQLIKYELKTLKE